MEQSMYLFRFTHWFPISRSIRPKVFYEEAIWKNLQNLQKMIPSVVLSLVKLQANSLQLCWKEFYYIKFSLDFAKLCSVAIFWNTSEWLLLDRHSAVNNLWNVCQTYDISNVQITNGLCYDMKWHHKTPSTSRRNLNNCSD